MANDRTFSSLQKTLGWAAAGVGVFMVAHALYREFTKFRLDGKVFLITGGSRGLGLVLARALAARGARLAICARSADKIELARQELERAGAEVMARVADVTDQGQVIALVNDVVSHYGRLDVVINNAGTIQVGPQQAMLIDDYEQAMKINFWAPLYAIHAALPHFREQGEGRIVNITSIGGKLAIPHLLPYSASKFAAVGLSEGMHAALKKENIHVTTVVPNLMRTGSPGNITVKGNHEAEYAWFKVSASLPLLSQDAEVAAKNIIKAFTYGEREAVLSLSGKLATAVKGIAPGWVGIILTLADKLLPGYNGNLEEKKGYEAESYLSSGRLTSASDQAAFKNNEM
jgi:NAD(P)-dependent dehydrogenase (short-subunit alcohol dehydrogenase family)